MSSPDHLPDYRLDSQDSAVSSPDHLPDYPLDPQDSAVSSPDHLPDYPLDSDLVRRLKSALDAADDGRPRELICTEVQPADAVIELANDDWMKEPSAQLPPAVLLGLWTLEYKRELTTPLNIAAGRGHMACVRLLLARGAHPDASPGGRGALHEACLGAHTACARLLLLHGADPDLPSADGLAPLHLCHTAASLGCAQALLEHGASVQRAGGAGLDTPLHVAAQRALDEHARLYLGRGARVDARNRRGETALSAACGAAPSPGEHARRLRLCALLLRRGADPGARDEDERSPLHKACGHARHGLCALLLRRGADPGALDYGGASPLARALQTATCAPPGAAPRTVQVLLNHGAPAVWPDALPQVLRACAAAPAVFGVLFNSYPRLRVPEAWREVIPEEAYQMHRPFYESLFALAHGPRCLQHLCRGAIRKLFGKRCAQRVPLLPVPKALQDYLLLEPEGVLH